MHIAVDEPVRKYGDSLLEETCPTCGVEKYALSRYLSIILYDMIKYNVYCLSLYVCRLCKTLKSNALV